MLEFFGIHCVGGEKQEQPLALVWAFCVLAIVSIARAVPETNKKHIENDYLPFLITSVLIVTRPVSGHRRMLLNRYQRCECSMG